MDASIGYPHVMRFRFAPRDGTRYTCISTRERTIAGAVDVARVEESVLIRRVGSGYQVITTPVFLSASRNGETIDDALQPIATSMIVIFEVDQHGRLTAVSGSDVTAKLEALIPEPLRPLVARMFSPEALFARNEAEWNGRYADLNGRELAWGSSYDWTSTFDAPNGAKATFWGTTALIEELEYAGRPCCKLRYAYGSDPTGLRELNNRLIRGLDIRAEMSGWDLSGEGERIVEADTMMIHSETVWRKGSSEIKLPGIGNTAVSFEEVRTWAYTFDLSGI